METINSVSKLDRYPIPKIEDLLATLSRGRSYTKYLKQPSQQLLLDEESKQFGGTSNQNIVNIHYNSWDPLP